MFWGPQKKLEGSPLPFAMGWVSGMVHLVQFWVLGGCRWDSHSMQRQPMRRQRAYASREDSLENWSPVRYLRRSERDAQQLGLPWPGGDACGGP